MRLIDRLRLLHSKPAARGGRFFKAICLDLVLINLSLVFGVTLAHEFRMVVPWSVFAVEFCLPITGLAIVLLAWRGVYRINARYMGLYDFLNIAIVGAVAGAGLAFLSSVVHGMHGVRDLWVAPLLFAYSTIALQSLLRIVQRYLDWQSTPFNAKHKRMRRALIVGAGDAGEMIVREMSRSRHSEHMAVGFVDDDPMKAGQIIHGVHVLGATESIPTLVESLSVDEILLAVPSADGNTIRRLVDLCDQSGARVRTLPPVAQILNNEHHVRYTLRDVDIEDLLRREPAKTDMRQTAGYISGETVLVTGGGGSIGSELARQIARLAPANLVLMGKGENSVYEIEQELIQEEGLVPTCIVGDIRDRQSIDSMFQSARPSVVFHAAAHKHVPLMQNNVVEAIKNNILGTQLVAEAAVRHGVKKFVYISTDKAVNPSSVMGATKRVGEMIVRSLAERSETEFAIVRFGNVLGSRGSLVPMLKKQILRGGPVRLTHPDMTRYFMTIPEAVQLIMQAGAMGGNGELFILDMGDPVKIVDLARDLIRLHGLAPGDDIEIQFTGVRPGEKTHEELVYEQEELLPTAHNKIRVVKPGQPIDYDWLKEEIQALKKMAESANQEQLRQCLMDLAWGKSMVPYTYAVTEVDGVESGKLGNS